MQLLYHQFPHSTATVHCYNYILLRDTHNDDEMNIMHFQGIITLDQKYKY